MDQADAEQFVLDTLYGDTYDIAYKRGQKILQPFDDSQYCYYIKSGIVKAYTISARGKEEARILYGKGELFPLPIIVDIPMYSTYFDALSDCVVAQIPLSEFLDAIKSDAGAGFEVLRKVIQQFTVYISRVDNLSYRYARERLAYRLLFLSTRFGETCDDGTMMLPLLTQHELGSTINLTRESVSRELGRLEDQNMIEYRDGRIAIIDPTRLRHQISSDENTLWFDKPKVK